MEWSPVINWDFKHHGPYSKGFDRDTEYEFKRSHEGDDKARVFRLSDQSEYFNVANLIYRPTGPAVKGL